MTEDEEAMINAGKMMKELVESRAWKVFEGALTQRIAMEGQTLSLPYRSIDEAVLGNFGKGTLNGLRLALRIPYDSVDNMKKLLEELAAQTPEDEEEDSDNG